MRHEITTGGGLKALLTDEHAVSSYGQPVLVFEDDGPVAPSECLPLSILAATDEGFAALETAGYFVIDQRGWRE